MNLKKILLSSVAAVALTSVAAFADSTSSGTAIVGAAVLDTAVAADQTGDYLVFPVYYANTAGWSTNLKVVNTNSTNAVVAKVVIREFMSSAEKLDFPIYLTPGDVWEGTLVNVGGTVYIQSTDDSMMAADGTPASATNPVNQALYAADTLQDNTKGYVEVFGIAEINATSVTPAWVVNTPLAKTALVAKYKAELNGNSTVAAWRGVNNDSIYGQEVISAANANGNLAMTLMATAFENVTGPTANTNTIIGQDTTIINSSNKYVTTTNVIADIENALQKSSVYATYYDASATAAAETSLLLTQPMKKYRYALSHPTLASVIGYTAAATIVGPTSYSFVYGPLARNQLENSLISSNDYSGGVATTYSCNYEVCQISVNSFVGAYTKGYVDFSLKQPTRSSMPVIPAVMTAKAVGTTNVTNIITPAFRSSVLPNLLP